MVPDELISNILKSIEIGLFQFGAEVQQVCFEFLQAFGTFIHLEQTDASFAYQSTMQFIGIVVEMVSLFSSVPKCQPYTFLLIDAFIVADLKPGLEQ